MLPGQNMRLLPLWQARQAALRSLAGVLVFSPKTTLGFGRLELPPLLFTCSSLAPWQLVQVGVRPSALVPCLVLPMESSFGLSLSITDCP